MFTLNPDLARDRLRAEFERSRQVQITPFIDERQATLLAASLRNDPSWREMISAGDKVFELDRVAQSSLDENRRAALEAAIAAGAREGFQFRYESIRVPDEIRSRAGNQTLLNQFAEFMSSAPVLDLMRDITGADDIAFADAQATAYRPGDFLSAHDDAVDGKGRRAAYVYGLTEAWQIEWGGLLMFHGDDGNVDRALVPRFDCLNLFSVPQMHSVSLVAPWAMPPRLSVTGWLRSGSSGN